MRNETLIAEKLANYVLDQSSHDPDSDICILARQFLRQRETVRSIVHAVGGHVFVSDASVMAGNDDRLDLVFSRNESDKGCDVHLRPRNSV